jgi:hypothetical protein
MHTITTGTPETRTEHSPGLAATGVMVAVGIPILIAIIGILTLGWGAIAWLGAIIWGIVATFCFTLFMMMGARMGMTSMDLPDMLGSMFAEPHTTTSRAAGAIMHHMNGALLSIAGAYGLSLVALPLNWWTGMLWGMVLTALALILFTSIGGVHPEIRRGRVDDPGTAATNLGSMTPLGSLLGHLVYGLVLGLLYQTWPLAL